MAVEGADSSIIAAAHELKAPLALLRQLSFELESTTDENHRREIIRRIRLTTERSLRLTDNLTKMARLGDAMFEMEPVQLSGLCHEVADELMPLSKSLGISFDIKVGKKPVVVVGHRELMRSLMIGLLDNALQYNQNEQPIQISVRLSAGKAMILVRDRGPIISLNQYRKLTNSLGNQAMPISARPLSSGLGLVIADRFVGAMRGRLSISRHRAGGMTFKVHLPLSRQLGLMEQL
jgi:two-component system sensor histidine kinase QseC